MNVLFLTMSRMRDINQIGVYTDLMRKFREEGHELYIISPCERREGQPTELIKSDGVHSLCVKTLNVKKTNVIEKGLGQVSMEFLFKRAYKKYFNTIHFDLILYSTPPVTYNKVIKFAKKRNPQAQTYLLLKDIFPQNAIDLGMMTKTGIKGLLYKSFRKKEERLYELSDHIGCMSPANVEYILAHNPRLTREKVELAPNSYEPVVKTPMSEDEKKAIRQQYGLPLSKPVFFYGGNLGKPQGIPFLIECMKANKDREDCAFVIVGNGTEYGKIDNWVKTESPKAVKLFERLPKADYDKLAEACDAGLIFLDYRFTIPNYPSRLLSCIMQRKPIIAATDPNCDTGTIAEKNGYGYYCPSNDVDAFTTAVNQMINSDIVQMGENGYQFYLNNYTTQHTYNEIIKHFK